MICRTLRILFVLFVTLTANGMSASSAVNVLNASYDFRAFGKIEASCKVMGNGASSWTTLSAKDEFLAKIVASKLLADLKGFGDVQNENGPATSLLLDKAGHWIIGLDGPRVHILFAINSGALAKLSQVANASSWQPVAETAHPRWLDRFDNDALGVGALGWGILPKDLNEGFKWLGVKKFGMAGGMLGGRTHQMVAPGIYSTSLLDYYAAVARKYDLSFTTYDMTYGPIRPECFWNVKPLPYYIPESEGTVAHPSLGLERLACSAEFAPSAATEPEFASAEAGFAAEQARYPYFNAIHATPELGGNYILLLPGVAGSPEVKTLWAAFLKERMGDLQTAGQLYLGNPKACQSWSDIPVTTMKVFAGWNTNSCLDLRRGEWAARPDQAKEGESKKWYSPNATSEGWVPLSVNDPLILFYDKSKNDFWQKRSFPVTPDTFSNLKYLHISRNAFHGSVSPPPDVYVNGRKAELITREPITWLSQPYDLCYGVKDLLIRGENLLVLNTHGVPVPGYVFMGPKGLWSYPSEDARLNRMYFDMAEFAASIVARETESWLRSKRAGDPEGRPLMIMSPVNVQDMVYDMAQKYGAYAHDTGQAGGCWAPWTTRGFATRGLPISCEPGNAPPDAKGMQKMITLYTLLGDDAVNMLFDPIQYKDNPEVSNWIDANMELLKCVGKADRPRPGFCALRSVRDASRLNFKAPWGWDISRGEAQAVGRSVDLVDTSDLTRKDRVGQWCNVLFDTGSELLTEEEISGLEDFVKTGGTFIAIQHTGKHSVDTANAWPISRLTGLKVISGNETSGKIRFTEKQSLWPSLRGKEFEVHGIALDFQNTDLTGPSIGMETTSRDIEVVAEWADKKPGEGKVAVAIRRIGKGKVVVLGSSFWRKAEDIGGSWKTDAGYRPYLAELLDSLQVPADSRRSMKVAENSDIFAEHFLSKNGIYDLYFMARVNDKAQPSKASITYTTDRAIPWLKEISAAGHPDVPFKYAPGGVTLSNIDLDAMKIRIFAAPRPDIACSTMLWLQSLQKRWYALEPLPASEIPAKLQVPSNIVPLIEDWTMVVGSDPGKESWKDTPPQDDSYWKSGQKVKLGTFAAMGIDEKSIAHFHKSVRLPKEWEDRRIFLTFAAPYWLGGVKYKGNLWIKGESATTTRPMNVAPQGAFTLEMKDAKPGGDLTLNLEVDGNVKDKEKRPLPSRVVGTFFLEALPVPVKTEPLGQWMAAMDVNHLSPAPASGKVTFCYLETKFKLPASQPAKRLFLESPGHLGWLILNGHVVSTPGWMNRLDISGMVRNDSGENVLRWVPAETESPSMGRKLSKEIPLLNLVWMRD